jgi:hypothetical protein
MTEQPRRWGRPDPMADPPSPSRLWNLPNALTMLRLLLVPVFGYLLLVDSGQSERSRWLAAIVFVVASATDLADGAIARARNLVTTFGKVADPIADKALTGVALLGLSWLGELPWWVTVVILGREITITVTRFIVIRHGVIPASPGGQGQDRHADARDPAVHHPRRWLGCGCARMGHAGRRGSDGADRYRLHRAGHTSA